MTARYIRCFMILYKLIYALRLKQDMFLFADNIHKCNKGLIVESFNTQQHYVKITKDKQFPFPIP